MKKLRVEEFIQRSNSVHKNRYDYSKVVYVNSTTKVCIVCSLHGEFYQLPNKHLSGQGCPKCNGSTKLTNDEFIERSKSIWGSDTFDYSKCVYHNIETKVVLICKKHQIEFQQTPYNHLKYKGISCSMCYEDKYNKKPNGYWTYERCYETAQKYSSLKDFYIGSFTVYEISVSRNYIKHFTWLGRIIDENLIDGKPYKIYKYEFPELNSVYIGLTINLERRYKQHKVKGSVFNFCKENGIKVPEPQIVENNLSIDEVKVREQYWIEFNRSIGYNLLNKAKGGGVGSLGFINKSNTQEFIAKAKQVHGDKYDYSKVKYFKAREKVEIVCPIHGLFCQRPSEHLSGRGCLKCRGKYKHINRNGIN